MAQEDEPPTIAEPLPAKDPLDWSLTASSTGWTTDTYCPQCHKTTCHAEKMSDICNGCGFLSHSCGLMKHRSYRQIWDGEKWVWQYKYGNTLDRMKFSEKRLHS